MESTRDLIGQFMKENPDIIVRTDVVAWQQYWQKMSTAVVTGTAQDVWLMSAAYVEQYAAAGHVMDLIPFIKADPTFNEDDYFPHAFDAYSFSGQAKNMKNVPFPRGKLYSFTRDYNCSLLYWNRDHFDAAGVAYPTDDWTWEDLVAAAKKLTIDFDGDGLVDQWGYYGMQFSTFAGINGGRWIDTEKRTGNFAPRPGSTQMFDAVQFCWDLIYKYKCSPPPSIQIEDDAFITGKASMIVEGCWEIRNYNRAKNLWDIAMVPKDVKDRKTIKGGGGVAHCIYSKTRQPDAAWRLVKFLSDEKSQRALGRSGTSVPVLKSAAFSEDFLADFDRPPKASYPVIWRTLEGATFVPQYSRGYLEYNDYIRSTLQGVWMNVRTPLEACQMIDKKLDTVLGQEYGREGQ